MRKIVRNDAIKSDPPEVYNWRAFALAAAVRPPHPSAGFLIFEFFLMVLLRRHVSEEHYSAWIQVSSAAS